MNPQGTEDRPRHFPAGFTEYVPTSVSEKFPPCHVTDDDVEPGLDGGRLEIDAILAYQFVQEWDGSWIL